MRLFDLSLRHKIPLWGSLLIVVSTLAVSAALLVRSYADLKQDMIASSAALGQTLGHTLFPTLLHDELWRAFEIINAPLEARTTHNPLEVESIFIVDPQGQVLAATDPKRLPTLSHFGDASVEHGQLAAALKLEPPFAGTKVFEPAQANHYFVVTPIAEAGRQIGLLVIAHDRNGLWTRFFELAGRSVLMGAVVVAVILPINWYWGRRTAEPLVALSAGMVALVHGRAVNLPPDLYAYRDELGLLFEAYRGAVVAMHDKALLEQEVLRSERLAAVGRLAAGIAHEVNNPVGGMLMAIDNLRQRGPLEPGVATTVALLERGLRHIADTVGALLVEARVVSRTLTPSDFDDLRTLIEPQVRKKQIALDWRAEVDTRLDLPAAGVRQVLINLLLNAVQATPSEGRIELQARIDSGQLVLVVTNTGAPLPEQVSAHLFEPFVCGREDGHGLGLWVSYMTVTQLGGRISVANEPGEVRFRVVLPVQGEPI